MPAHANLKVLHAFNPLARSLAVFNWDNFSNNHPPHIVRRNTLQAVCCGIAYVSIIVISVMNGWSVFVFKLGWSERAFHLVVMLCLLQQFFIYTSMARKNRQIIEAMDQLQQSVTNREHLQSFCIQI